MEGEEGGGGERGSEGRRRHEVEEGEGGRRTGGVAGSETTAIRYQRSAVNLGHVEAAGEESIDGRTESPQRTTRCFVATQHDIGVP